MKLLLDANLSYRLVKKLSDIYPECLHVLRTGLPVPANDIDSWNWAKKHGYMFIITNDEDFKHLVERFGFPPKVVLLRTGNQSTDCRFYLFNHCSQFGRIGTNLSEICSLRHSNLNLSAKTFKLKSKSHELKS
ncbi:MAG: DUF5615 family PIN-like protein [Lewinellaceae bacterium]|nr:DUF5615 family PIN-like protein [Lewinellaceae bacterium]